MVFEASEQDWDAVIKVHLYGHFYCTRFASTIMKEQGNGRIINTSFSTGFRVSGMYRSSPLQCGKRRNGGIHKDIGSGAWSVWSDL